jgi:hypothetical protein
VRITLARDVLSEARDALAHGRAVKDGDDDDDDDAVFDAERARGRARALHGGSNTSAERKRVTQKEKNNNERDRAPLRASCEDRTRPTSKRHPSRTDVVRAIYM